jgi:hypothetical protein
MDTRQKHPGKPLREAMDITFLDRTATSSPVKYGLYEAKMSCLIHGFDHRRWTAYFIKDNYFGEPLDDLPLDYLAEIHGDCGLLIDPLMSGYNDATKPLTLPREYFLQLLFSRLTQILKEFSACCKIVQDGVRQYVC